MWRLGLLAATASCTALATPGSSTVTSGTTGVVNEPDLLRLTISDHPAEPSVGVKGDVPAIYDRPFEVNPATDVECTAARDHCLPPLAWFWIHEGETTPTGYAHAIAFTREGPASASGGKAYINQDNYTAYRTVPATRDNLVPGAFVVVHPDPVPATPADAFGYWTFGTVERVDWELELFIFERNRDPRQTSSARVAVLRYRPGEKVTSMRP